MWNMYKGWKRFDNEQRERLYTSTEEQRKEEKREKSEESPRREKLRRHVFFSVPAHKDGPLPPISYRTTPSSR